MSAPLVKGLIIGTSILLAAGLALYESEQFQTWFEAQRRRIVLTLDGLANAGATPEQQTRRAEEMETELREQVVRRHRADIIQRARDDGVAVDLDELEAVESIYDAQQALLDEAAKNKQDRDERAGKSLSRTGTARSFDELVGHDGRLRQEAEAARTSSAVVQDQSGLRQRGTGSSAFARGAAFGGNPFDDDALFDQDLIGAGGEELADLQRTSVLTGSKVRGSTVTHVAVQDDSSQQEPESPYKTDAELDAEIQEAIQRSLEYGTETPEHHRPLIGVDDAHLSGSEMLQMPSSASSSSLLDASTHTEHIARSESPSLQGSIYESYYYGAPQHTRSSNEGPPPQNAAASVSSFHSTLSEQLAFLQATSQYQPPQHLEDADDWDSDDALTPAGSLTPTEDTFSMAGDVSPVISGSRSRTLSNAGSVAISEDFSEVGSGVMTPASWTDVDSVVSDEEVDPRSRSVTVT